MASPLGVADAMMFHCRNWYAAESFFHQKLLCDDLVANLYDLNDLHFDISPRGVDLDTGWPTFAW